MDERTTTSKLGLSYHSLPIASRAALSWDAAGQLNALLEQAEGPILVHCRSGNRAGALFALRAGLDPSISVDQALKIGREHGLTSLDAHIQPLLLAGPPVLNSPAD